ncbi:hypothetical protein F511_12950 [Dorcoceras hygrometricum]|uniref:Uncharacterized protein n=1 Tax=Dorcoceras hygrometricum TaxID=472368 RepID=A0A2Z7BJ18_9LAMI|nr:hypothetical protein F511_12950 [Dorcoceras hygrometricum]
MGCRELSHSLSIESLNEKPDYMHFKMTVSKAAHNSEKPDRANAGSSTALNQHGEKQCDLIKISGRGRGRNIPVDESNPDSNTSIAQLLRLLVEQQGRGNGQSSSSRGPSNDDPQERFRRQKPREFSGTIDPFVAESWIKSME